MGTSLLPLTFGDKILAAEVSDMLALSVGQLYLVGNAVYRLVKAAGTLTSPEGLALQYNNRANRTVELTAGTSAVVAGVTSMSQVSCAVGDLLLIQVGGRVQANAGGNTTAGQLLTGSADGELTDAGAAANTDIIPLVEFAVTVTTQTTGAGADIYADIIGILP